MPAVSGAIGPLKLKGRYELREALGRGGMGVVYRAYDSVLKCDVAVKTLHQAADPAVVQLFHRECEVLVALNHPNIVQILDLGEFEHEGCSRPYFVMPLLPGMALSELIRNPRTGFTAQRRVEILSQVCRGLNAAHERGLIHRDIKPANILVMPDYSAEIIDFGVAHVVDAGVTGIKGTVQYMAPELIEGKAPTPLSDIFAMGVTAYELFTLRRPFERSSERETIEAILHETPPPASTLDPTVNQAIGRVIHKAMAKQPWHRFSTAREFGECLEMAWRGQPIECFDPERIRPRLGRAKAACEQGDHQLAVEILSELEAEGHVDAELASLRRHVDLTLRQKLIHQLLEAARVRFGLEEYPLALQKVQEVLTLEPDNAEALALRSRIEGARAEGQIEGWFRLARQHIGNNAFAHAREALENVLKTHAQDTRAQGLLSEVTRREQEYRSASQEKEQLYQTALEAWQKGDVSGALTKLERLLDIERRAPDSANPERSNSYQNLYNQARSEHDRIRDAYSKARKHLDDRDFANVQAICEEYLQKYPGHALFQSLKFDALEQHRLQLSACVAEIDHRVEAESDLGRKVAIVEEAVARFPGEPHFEQLARIMRERADLVDSIVAKARYHEEQGQFNEALGQWEILRTIHAGYPGLQTEIDRVIKRRGQQARMEGKTRRVRQIEAHLESGSYDAALQACRIALEEFPDDGEVLALRQLTAQAQERCGEALRLAAQGEQLFDGGAPEEGLECLRKAREMDQRNDAIRTGLINRLVARAQHLVEMDGPATERLVQEALYLEPGHAGAKGVRMLLDELRRERFLEQSIARVRQLQAAGDLPGALAQIAQALSFYPDEPRLTQLRANLESKAEGVTHTPHRQRDLEQLHGLAVKAGFVSDAPGLESILENMRSIAAGYPREREFQLPVEEVANRLMSASAPQPLSAPGATEILGTPGNAGSPTATTRAARLPASKATLASSVPTTTGVAQEPTVLEKRAPVLRWTVILIATIPALIAGCVVTWIALQYVKSARVATSSVTIAQSRAPLQPARQEPANPPDSASRGGQSQKAIPASPSPGGVPFARQVTAREEKAVPPSVKTRPASPLVSAEPARSRTTALAVRPMDAADWDQPLVKDGEWWVRQGGDFVLYRPTPTAGTFVFTLRPSSSSSKVQWVLDYSDEKNYILFQIDKKSYSCFAYVGGKKNQISKKPHNVKSGAYTVKMVVEQDHLTVMMASDKGELTTVHEWTRTGNPFIAGQFGLYYPGNTRMWLANFSFAAQPPTTQ